MGCGDAVLAQAGLFVAYATQRNFEKPEPKMTPTETWRIQQYLRQTFDNAGISVVRSNDLRGVVEVEVNGEFLGVVHRDEEEGEVSYALMISILEECLPPPGPVQRH